MKQMIVASLFAMSLVACGAPVEVTYEPEAVEEVVAEEVVAEEVVAEEVVAPQ